MQGAIAPIAPYKLKISYSINFATTKLAMGKSERHGYSNLHYLNRYGLKQANNSG
ncbi:hypothetical protein ACR30L_04500 [Psychromonas sp. PT13]|uniref:hypothetical protein n=1 Tax=Psychromonas sp. PT13 TaxID=3439547 RepID=UPI003EB6FAF0